MRPNAIRAASAADACAEAAKGVDVPANAALPARLTPADEHAGIARLFEMTSDLLATLSSDGRLTLINPAWEQALGWSAQELLSKPLIDFVHPDDVDQTLVCMLSAGGHEAELENFTNRIRHHDGEWRSLAWSGRCDGEVWYLAARDVSERASLELQALHDPLTKLPNRLLLMDRAHQALARLHRSKGPIALLFIDLDGFKPVNDSFGHAAGDSVLKEAALRLLSVARDSDTVARVGGDEFVLLMEDVVSLADCVTLARRLVEAVSRPFDIANRQVQISGSVGIVVHPDHGRGDKLVANADAAMYAAKRTGGGTYAMFEPHMDIGALEELNLQNDLRHAVELRQLQLYYQPKVDGRDGRISGVEALLRWNHPERGMILPGVFIPIAERFGLIKGLGDWVIEEACRQMHAWAVAGMRMRVAINLSVHQLRQDDLVARIQQALDRYHLEASQLLCEITESVAMDDIKATHRAFDGLGRRGVYLSIDDFGTGYSSLSYLRKLPARQLKIDQSFVKDLEVDSDARAVVDAVVRLAHALGLDVVAEGVESAGQRDILLKLGCDELQGFFFAQPMPADAMLAWANLNRPENAVDFSPSGIAD